MRARYHGEQIATTESKSFVKALSEAAQPTVGFMFDNLTDDPDNCLPISQTTIDALTVLGRAMADDPRLDPGNIPAAYTYFGQFVDHDITKTIFDSSVQVIGAPDPIEASSFTPLARGDVSKHVRNGRSAGLDLDSVYKGPALEATSKDGRMRLSAVAPAPFGTISTSDRFHDLPRRKMIANPTTEEEQELDRQALIGDPRNDENLLVAQLHVGILRSHNALMDKGLDGVAAQSAIRRRYQWIVLHDFLPRICEKETIEDVLTNGATHWVVNTPEALFMPIEFSAAAYRFGHSMIRADYSHNATFNPQGIPATFNLLFTFTALSGDLQPGNGPNFQFETLPDNWIIEWHRFFGTEQTPASDNPARKIDTNLTPELGNLRDFQGLPIPTLMAKLAARNLLRGYLLGLPTGQAVAKRLSIEPLSGDILRAAVPSGLADAIGAAGFFERTPLWFYILAEAGNPAGPNGNHLGPVGSRIVAETFWNLARHSTDSVVVKPPTQDELDSGGFTLKDLIKLGQDRGMPPIA